MLSTPLIESLRTLKLLGILKAYEELQQMPDSDALSFDERLHLLIERERQYREAKQLQSRLKKAKLRMSACAEDIDYRVSRGLDKSLMMTLAQGNWIAKHRNLIIVGPTGTGKSYIACALAQKACLIGYRSLFFKLSRLLDQFTLARAEGKYIRMLNDLSKVHLLVIDDWGSTPLSDHHRRDLLELLDDRYERSSTIITSQFDVKHWHDLMGDPTLADAILDRVIHNAQTIVLKGESMRKIKERKTVDQTGKKGGDKLINI